MGIKRLKNILLLSGTFIVCTSSFSQNGKPTVKDIPVIKKYAFIAYIINCTTICDSVNIRESGLSDIFQEVKFSPGYLMKIDAYAERLSRLYYIKDSVIPCNCASKALDFYNSKELDYDIRRMIK